MNIKLDDDVFNDISFNAVIAYGEVSGSWRSVLPLTLALLFPYRTNAL